MIATRSKDRVPASVEAEEQRQGPGDLRLPRVHVPLCAGPGRDVGECPASGPEALHLVRLRLNRAGGTTPDGVGDLCQNADFNRDGVVDILDVTLERRALIGLEPTLNPAQPPSTP